MRVGGVGRLFARASRENNVNVRAVESAYTSVIQGTGRASPTHNTWRCKLTQWRVWHDRRVTKELRLGAWDMAHERPRARDSSGMGGRYTYLGRAPLLVGRHGSARRLSPAQRGITPLVLGRPKNLVMFRGLHVSLL